jgi:hypothetical protein
LSGEPPVHEPEHRLVSLDHGDDDDPLKCIEFVVIHLEASLRFASNKDRAEHRNIFVAKCAALVQKRIAVSIIDFVTARKFNLYSELLAFIGHTDPTFGDSPPPLYAASCRWTMKANRTIFEAWSHELSIGQPLPILPLWLSTDLVVPLELESSYEQSCNDLWIL